MNFAKLISDISSLREMPVRIEFIVDWLRANGFQDEIFFYPVNTDFKIAPAWFVRKKEVGVPYADAKKITYIYYSVDHNECWRRLFICKELMHFFDKENACTGDNQAAINNLIGDLIKSNAFSIFRKLEAKDLGILAAADEMAFARALLCLAPAHVTDALKEQNVLEKKQLIELAHFFKIPEVFIEDTLSDAFLITHSSVIYEQPLKIVSST